MRQAFAQGQAGAALAAALEVWREGRDPLIAEVIEALDATTSGGLRLISTTRREAFHAEWMALAAGGPGPEHAVALGWLTANIGRLSATDSVVRPDGTRAYPLALRAQRLLEGPPDPRIALTIFDLVVRRAAFGASFILPGREAGPMLEAAARMDPRVAAQLLAQVEAPSPRASGVRDAIVTWVQQRRADLEAAAQRVTPAPDQDQWQALLRLIRPSGPDPEALRAVYAQVFEAIDDDAPREVLADLLLAADAPQGEYIARALAEPDSKPARRLLRAHGAEWLGPALCTVLAGVEYTRGLPVRARLKKNGVAHTDLWTAATQAPQLGSFTELRIGVGARATYDRFLFSPAALNLRGVDITSKAALDRLCARDQPRRLRAAKYSFTPSRAVLDKIAGAPAFEALETLWVPVPRAGLEALAKDLEQSGLHERLSRIGLFGHLAARPPTLEPLGLIVEPATGWFGV